MGRKKKGTALPSAEAAAPTTDASVDTQVTILPQETPPPVKSIKFVVLITRDGITDKDGHLVEPQGNVYAKISYENKGDVLNISKTSGKIAQLCLDAYHSMSKGVNKRYPFNLKMDLSLSEGNEILELDVKSRINSPVDTAFAIAAILNHTFSDDNTEGYLTGNFVVSKENALFNRRLGFPDYANNMPQNSLDVLYDDKRRHIKKENQLNVHDVRERIGYKFPVKKPKKVAADVVAATTEATPAIDAVSNAEMISSN